MELKQKTEQTWLAVATLVLLLLFSFNAYSQSFSDEVCTMQTYPTMNFYVNYQHQTTGMFGAKYTNFPPVTVEGCRAAAGQHLAFGIALNTPSLEGKGDLVVEGVVNPSICEIKNAPITMAPFEKKIKVVQEQYKLLRSCMKIEIAHLDQKHLEFNPNQKFCKIERISPTKLLAQGDMCFLPIPSDLRVALSLIIDKNCLSADYLKNNNLQISDLEAFLNAYIVPDDTGTYINNQIGSQKVRLVMLPDENLMPVSKNVLDNGPRFPTDYAANVFMGQIRIKDDSRVDEKRTHIDLQLFVDHLTERKCHNGICAGPGDYQVPLAGEVELYEISNGKRAQIDSWHTGNIMDPFVKAQWQGLTAFGKKVIENYKMETGKEYEVQMNFYNPYDDYILLTHFYEQLAIDLSSMSGIAGQDKLMPIQPINPRRNLPKLGKLPRLTVEASIESEFDKIKLFFQRFGTEAQFPPVYGRVCKGDLSQCLSTQRRSYFTKLTTRFKLGEVNPDDYTFKLENVRVKKESPIFEGYDTEVAGLPEYSCPL